MSEFGVRGFFWIIFSFGLAFMLTILPLPHWSVWWRPLWVLLVLIYWSMALPHRISVGVALIIGLLMDVLLGYRFGETAIPMIIVIYLVSRFNHPLRVIPLWQQTMAILFLVGLYQFISLWIQVWLNQFQMHWDYWLPVLTSTLLWPLIYFLLRDVRVRFRLA